MINKININFLRLLSLYAKQRIKQLLVYGYSIIEENNEMQALDIFE